MSEKLLTPTQLFTLKEPTDLNTCLPGIYRIKPNKTKNAPTDGYGVLISTEDSDSSMITQIFFGLGGGSNTPGNTKIFWRNKLLSVWGGWGSY
uniref:Uncharacterized protein n=1 Tax=Myoviridae sp. ctn8H20 TaxID=2825169 RepID=A0A8S5QFK6_9CAUD|nr:MAG TPA: hypothetical protein [Myoviridae sp. ctn8H20]